MNPPVAPFEVCMSLDLLVISALALAGSGPPVLLKAGFEKDASPLVAGDPASLVFESGGLVVDGNGRSFTSTESFWGDLRIGLEFSKAFHGGLTLVIGSEPGIRCEISAKLEAVKLGDGATFDQRAWPPAPIEKLELTMRSDAAELRIDGATAAFVFVPQPVGGGPLVVEIHDGAAGVLDSLVVERLPYLDREVVEGLDDVRLARLAELPLSKFRILDPPPSSIDPVYRIGVDGESDPVVVRSRGTRADAERVPLLEQALALARIRPWLDVTLLEGDGREGDKPLARESPEGPFLVTRPPGIIRVAALCGIVDEPPVLLVMDVTRDRPLMRSCPGGPAAADVFAFLPPKCDRIRVSLGVKGRPTIERFYDFKRP